MGIVDILILAVLAIWFAVAVFVTVRQIIRRKRHDGCCCGSCSGCGFSCPDSKHNKHSSKNLSE